MDNITKFEAYFKMKDKNQNYNFESLIIIKLINSLDNSLVKSSAWGSFTKLFQYKKTSVPFYIERGWTIDEANQKFIKPYSTTDKIRKWSLSEFKDYCVLKNKTINFNSNYIDCRVNEIFNKYMETSKYELLKLLVKSFETTRPSLNYYIERGWSVDDSNKMLQLTTNKRKLSESKFISLYGGIDGSKRWIEFKEKSAQTESNYIKRLGIKRGIIEWDKHKELLSNAQSEQGFIEKHGELVGKEKWSTRNNNISNSLTLEGFIEKHGELVGKEKWESFVDSKKHDKKYFIKRYGIEDGEKRWNKFRRKSIKNLENFQRVHGSKQGEIKYEEYRTKLKFSNSLDGYKLKYGDDTGYRLFKDKLTNMQKGLKKAGEASKQSLSIFTPVAQWLVSQEFELNFDFFYGIEESNEFSFHNSLFSYDFTLPILKLIFEFNGSHVHPSKSKLSSDEWSAWRNPFNGQTADEKYTYDQKKIQFAQNNDYTVIELWDYENPYDLVIKVKKIIMESTTKV